MTDVFISYRSTERGLVDKLAEDIEKLGHDVWFDEQLTGGHKWWDQILHEIRRADIIVLALSPASLASEPCRRERQYSLDLKKNIIPVQIVDGVNFKLLPSSISQLQVVNYINPDIESALSLGRSFNNLPPAQSLPDPLPDAPPVPLSAFAEIKDILEQPAIPVDKQDAVLSRLRRMLRKDEDREDALILIKQLRRHRDVRVHIAEDIDSIIEDSQARPIAEIRKSVPPAPQQQASVQVTEQVKTPDLAPVKEQSREPGMVVARQIPEPKWASMFMPDWETIAATIGLYLLFTFITHYSGVAYDYSNQGSALFFGAWLLLTLAQGYITRWLTYNQGLHDHNFHFLDIFYGGPLTFLLARRIYRSFRWRDLIISIIGWVLALMVVSLYISIFGTSANLFELRNLAGLLSMAIVGGYVTGLVLRMAHKDAYKEYLAG